MTEIIISLIGAAVLLSGTARNFANSSAGRPMRGSEAAMLAGGALMIGALIATLF